MTRAQFAKSVTTSSQEYVLANSGIKPGGYVTMAKSLVRYVSSVVQYHFD